MRVSACAHAAEARAGQTAGGGLCGGSVSQ